jgi:hypothetical protein
VLTVFINVLIWDKHASREGLGCLAVSLVAAALYQQVRLVRRTPFHDSKMTKQRRGGRA